MQTDESQLMPKIVLTTDHHWVVSESKLWVTTINSLLKCECIE